MKISFPLSKFTSLRALSGALALNGVTGGCEATRTSDSSGQYVDDTVTRLAKMETEA